MGRGLTDVLFPPMCHACGEHLGDAEGSLCPACDRALAASQTVHVCPTCAADTGTMLAPDGYCPECRDGPRSPRATARGGAYDSIVGEMLRTHKYGDRPELEALLADLVACSVEKAPWRKYVEAVVPVPTHWRRRLWRGVHIVDGLAARLAARLDLPLVRALRRVEFKGSQVGLSYTARRENVRGAFALPGGLALAKPVLLLVDDVRTTGATLGECARTLKRAGAREVYAAVAARVCFGDKRAVSDLPV